MAALPVSVTPPGAGLSASRSRAMVEYSTSATSPCGAQMVRHLPLTARRSCTVGHHCGRRAGGCLVGFHSQSSISLRIQRWLSKANHTYRVVCGLSLRVQTPPSRTCLAERLGPSPGRCREVLRLETRWEGVLLEAPAPDAPERITMPDDRGDHGVTGTVVSAHLRGPCRCGCPCRASARRARRRNGRSGPGAGRSLRCQRRVGPAEAHLPRRLLRRRPGARSSSGAHAGPSPPAGAGTARREKPAEQIGHPVLPGGRTHTELMLIARRPTAGLSPAARGPL